MHEMDSPFPLYGSVPIMYAHRKDVSVGVFWILNPSETYVDITKTRPKTKVMKNTNAIVRHS